MDQQRLPAADRSGLLVSWLVWQVPPSASCLVREGWGRVGLASSSLLSLGEPCKGAGRAAPRQLLVRLHWAVRVCCFTRGGVRLGVSAWGLGPHGP